MVIVSNRLAHVERDPNKRAELLVPVAAQAEAVLGFDHPYVSSPVGNLAAAYYAAARYAEAAQVSERCIESANAAMARPSYVRDTCATTLVMSYGQMPRCADIEQALEQHLLRDNNELRDPDRRLIDVYVALVNCNPARAIPIARQTLEDSDEPHNRAIASLVLADANIQLGFPERAREWLPGSASLQEGDPEDRRNFALLSRGLAMLEGDWEQTLALGEQMARDDQISEEELNVVRAEVALKRGDDERALELLPQPGIDAGEYPEPRLRGLILTTLGRHHDALVYFEASLDLPPRVPWQAGNAFHYAQSLLATGNQARAVEIARQAAAGLVDAGPSCPRDYPRPGPGAFTPAESSEDDH